MSIVAATRRSLYTHGRDDKALTATAVVATHRGPLGLQPLAAPEAALVLNRADARAHLSWGEHVAGQRGGARRTQLRARRLVGPCAACLCGHQCQCSASARRRRLAALTAGCTVREPEVVEHCDGHLPSGKGQKGDGAVESMP